MDRRASGIVAGRLFGLLRLDARGAVVEDRVFVRKRRNAFDVLVRMVKVIITRVPEALVPKKTLGVALDGVDRSEFLDVLLMEGEPMVHDGSVTK